MCPRISLRLLPTRSLQYLECGQSYWRELEPWGDGDTMQWFTYEVRWRGELWPAGVGVARTGDVARVADSGDEVELTQDVRTVTTAG